MIFPLKTVNIYQILNRKEKIMKMKMFFAVAAALSICTNTAVAVCASAGIASETSDSKTSAANSDASQSEENKSVTLCESWTFDAGFYAVVHGGMSSNYGISYWGHNFYDTLVVYEDGEYKGSLAEKWNVSEDGKEYTFTLRDGIKFSDGTPCDATAVKKSLEAAAVNLGAYIGSYGKLMTVIDTIEAPDESTVVIKLTQPYYGTLNDLSTCNPLGIVNPNGFNDDLTYKADDFQTMTMGTGPYMYQGDFDGSVYTFVRNPYYWGETPEADTFKIKVIPDNDAKVLALRSGEIDAITGAARLSADAYTELSADSSFGTAINDEPTLTNYIGFNMAKEPFDDKNVRLAVEYAIDRDSISNDVFQGTMTPAGTLFSKSKPYCDVEATVYSYDPDKAAQLLEEAGWTDSDGDGIRDKDGTPLEMTMLYTSDYGSIGDGMLAIASQLGKVGFKVNVSDMDMMTYYEASMNGEYDIIHYRTYGGSFDPFTVVTNMDPTVSADPVAVQFAEFLPEGIVSELDCSADESRISEIYNTILTTIPDEALCVPFANTVELAAWNSDKINSYEFSSDSQYVEVSGIDIK